MIFIRKEVKKMDDELELDLYRDSFASINTALQMMLIQIDFSEVIKNAIEPLEVTVNLTQEIANNLATNIEPMFRAIQALQMHFTKHLRDMLETLEPLFRAIIILIQEQVKIILAFDWGFDVPSFYTSDFDISNPSTGPPVINEYQNEKEQFKRASFVVFAYLIIIVMLGLGFPSFYRFGSEIFAVISNEPFAVFLVSGMVRLVSWLISKETKNNLKNHVLRGLRFFKIW